MQKRVLAALCFVGLGACTIVFPGNFSYPGVPCRMMSGWCVLEVPSVGDLAVGAGNSGQLNHTVISFRLAPREGVTAEWWSTQVTVTDVDTGKSMRIEALDSKSITGRRLAPTHIGEELFVLYGPYSPGEFRLEPRIARMEIRFPPLFGNGRTFQVPPVRIDDGTRLPTPVLLFGAH